MPITLTIDKSKLFEENAELGNRLEVQLFSHLLSLPFHFEPPSAYTKGFGGRESHIRNT